MLVAFVAAIGLVDLSLTVAQMRSGGLCEANPIARAVAAHGPLALIGFKIAATALSGGVLIALRRRRSAEVGAWIVAAASVVVVGAWIAYLGEPIEREALRCECRSAWVTL